MAIRRWGLRRSEAEPRIHSGPSASQLLVGSFALLIAVGTLGFLTLPGLYAGEGLGFVDALFTATSAVCVTGLIVVDTATFFTPLGQVWVALLIQLGGIGILALATLIISTLGRRMSLEWERAGGGHATVVSHVSQKALLWAVVRLTLVIEGLGAVLLWLLWRGRLGDLGAIWPAVFHAVSAFCNAGFSIFSSSLVPFQSAPLTLLVVSLLIVVGGLGYLVLEELRLALRPNRESKRRLSLHSRLVLVTTGILLAGAMLLYLFFETGFDLRQLNAPDRLVNAWFMSVTARTAGFNSVDYGGASNASIFLTLLLMVIGGSPGSTAGGVKTTSVVLLFLLLSSRLRGRPHTSVWGRTIPRETLERAAGVVIAGVLVLALFTFTLLVVELPASLSELDRGHFLSLVFEAHSAFGTVGLSLGATPQLTPGGRLLITLLMFIGRVGPLALAASMVLRRRAEGQDYRFAHEDVVVG